MRRYKESCFSSEKKKGGGKLFPLYDKIANYKTSPSLYGSSKAPYSKKLQMDEDLGKMS
jgi:hypothetical protein